MKEMALLTLQEALSCENVAKPLVSSSSAPHLVPCRRLASSRESLRSWTREYLLPPQLLPGPHSILIDVLGS